MIAGNKSLPDSHTRKFELGCEHLDKGKSELKRGHPRRARANLRIAKQLLPRGKQSQIASYHLMRTYINEILRDPVHSSLITARKIKLFRPALRLSVKFRIIYVSVDVLRCQEKPFSDLLGFSGETIDCFPPFSFFKQYVINPNQARMRYASWLYHGLVERNGWKIPHSQGGWSGGSLVRLIYDRHNEAGMVLIDIKNADQDLIKQAILEKTDYYFDLFTSILSNGYRPSTYPPIYCQRKNKLYYIKDGHHRCAAAVVLNHEQIPIVVVSSENVGR